jgi:hypothetical protein
MNSTNCIVIDNPHDDFAFVGEFEILPNYGYLFLAEDDRYSYLHHLNESEINSYHKRHNL